MMNFKSATYLAGIVLTIFSLSTSSFGRTLHLEKIVDPNDVPVKMPANFTSNPTVVDRYLVYDFDPDQNKVPVKTLKITNHYNRTVYPVMRDGNEAATTNCDGKGLYDPYDTVGREYRGYIGHKGHDGHYYFGLEHGKSILVRVPLVFWNGARIGIVTDSEYLTPGAGQPNPLSYDPSADMIIFPSESDPTDKDVIKDGVVMWYTAPLKGPALDSPDQLAEWTIRDKEYLSSEAITNETCDEIPESERVTLINYDVSYVDNMFLSGAMEALDVPIPAPPYPPGRLPQPYGWIGAINCVEDLQHKIRDFTDLDNNKLLTDPDPTNNKLLGEYFDGKGWPTYNIPIKERKIPAGQNIFAQSPLADVRSSYNNNTYMLSSGGGANLPISVTIGGGTNTKEGTTLYLSGNEPKKKIEFIQRGFTVVGHPPQGQQNPIQEGTKVVSVDVDAHHVKGYDEKYYSVVLNKPLVASEEGCAFEFFRPADDYASDAMIKIWYSWAKIYLDDTQDTPTKMIEGAIEKNSATLRFASPQDGLVPGMQVTGPGLPDPDPSEEKGGVVILEIAADQKSVTLSQLSSQDHTSEGYEFIKPQPLPSTPSDLYDYDFSGDVVNPARKPQEFAKKVYLIMASMAQIAKNADPNVKAPHVLELMNNVIGGNMGFIFETNAQRFSPAGLAISAVIRDMIKSVLRGVTDFTKYPEYTTDGKRVWYPDPSEHTGNQKFNVFNLDPFVWFVHVELGFSGYGFSLDDDTADVGAGQATRFLMTIGGRPSGDVGPTEYMVTTAENANEWTIQTPYGPVVGTGAWDPTESQKFYLGITGATNTRPIVITSVKHGLGNGEEVTIDQVEGNTAANGTFTVANATQDTFELAGTAGNGNYTSGGRWTRGPLPYITFKRNVGIDGVYWRVKGDDKNAGFLGAIVSGPGVHGEKSVRVVQLGDDSIGQLAISKPLTGDDGDPLPAGSYEWTFSGKPLTEDDGGLLDLLPARDNCKRIFSGN